MARAEWAASHPIAASLFWGLATGTTFALLWVLTLGGPFLLTFILSEVCFLALGSPLFARRLRREAEEKGP